MPALRRLPLVFCLLLPFGRADAESPSSAPHIARFQGDRAGAVSYTFDDGLRDQYITALPMLDAIGIKGTFFVIPGKISADVADAERRQNDKRAWGTITWDELRKMAAEGHEIASHTWDHQNLVRLTPDQVDAELTRSYDAILKNIGRPPLTLAYPFNSHNPAVDAAALGRYIAYRDHQFGTGGRTTLESFNKWADKQAADHTWGVVMTHAVAHGYAALTNPAIFLDHLKYVKSRSGDIWAAPFGDVARYVNERDAARLSVSSQTAAGATFTLACPLDPARYDVPLTVVFPHAGVSSARAGRGGRELPVRVAANAIQIDASPGPDPVIVTWK